MSARDDPGHLRHGHGQGHGQGHGHGHGHGVPDVRLGASARARRVLVALVVAIAVASGLAVLVLWPSGHRPSAPVASAGGDVVHATVASVHQGTCRGTTADRRPDGRVPASVPCPSVRARMTSGPDAGRATTVDVPAADGRSLSAGARVDLALFPPEDGQGRTYAWGDVDRSRPLALVAAGFVVLVVVVGRARGVAALLGLLVAYATILGFVVPALVDGEQPVLVALSGAVAIMTVVLYLAHGFSLKTAAAHLGTTLGLALTAVLGPVAVAMTSVRGQDDADGLDLSVLTGRADLSAFVLAGVVISALGVLNDVTVTQASAVWELRGADPGAGFAALFARGMRIGRDHLASTVYTLAFAYAGAALPALVLLQLEALPAAQVLTSSAIAEEVVRTAVGGACLVAAIPFTTAVAAAAVATSTTGRPRGRRAAGAPAAAASRP